MAFLISHFPRFFPRILSAYPRYRSYHPVSERELLLRQKSNHIIKAVPEEVPKLVETVAEVVENTPQPNSLEFVPDLSWTLIDISSGEDRLNEVSETDVGVVSGLDDILEMAHETITEVQPIAPAEEVRPISPEKIQPIVPEEVASEEIQPIVLEEVQPEEIQPIMPEEVAPEEIQPIVLEEVSPEEIQPMMPEEVAPEEIQHIVPEEVSPEEIQPIVPEEVPPEEIQPIVPEEVSPEEIQPIVPEEVPPEEIQPIVPEEVAPEEIQPNVLEEVPPEEIQVLLEEIEPNDTATENITLQLDEVSNDMPALITEVIAHDLSAIEPQIKTGSTVPVSVKTPVLPEEVVSVIAADDLTDMQRQEIVILLARYTRAELMEKVSARGWARKGNKEALARKLVVGH